MYIRDGWVGVLEKLVKISILPTPKVRYPKQALLCKVFEKGLLVDQVWNGDACLLNAPSGTNKDQLQRTSRDTSVLFKWSSVVAPFFLKLCLITVTVIYPFFIIFF